MSFGDECEAIVLESADNYWNVFCNLRITYDDFITPENEPEFMDTLMAMFSDFVSKDIGTIKAQSCGVEHYSGHEGCEKNNEGYNQKIYVGDKCKHHVHVFMQINVKNLIWKNKLAKRELMEAADRPSLPIMMKSCCNKWWREFKLSKMLPEEWFSRRNKCHLGFDLDIGFDDIYDWLSYPLKELDYMTENCKTNDKWQYNALSSKYWLPLEKDRPQLTKDGVFDRENNWVELRRQRCRDFKRDMDLSQKKKDSALAKDTCSFGIKLADYIQKKGGVLSKETCSAHILEYYKDHFMKFTVMEIVSWRNLIMANSSDKDSQLILDEINSRD